jgi:peptidoglycan/LPS O-acetylase OafA/YrhL
VPWRSFLTDARTFEYMFVTISGWDVRDQLPGAFAGNPYPWAVNGSLWTLPIELKFYVGCLVAGVFGLLRRPWRFNVALFAAVVLFEWHPDWFPVRPEIDIVRTFALAFALGAFAWVNRHRLPLSPWLALVALVVLFANPLGFGRGVYFHVLVAYVLLVFALHPALRIPAFNRLGDYSYGLYVYSFPIQQMLIYRWADVTSVTLFWTAFPITLALAIVSWHVLEARMLRLKRAFPGAAEHGTATTSSSAIAGD